MAAVLAALFCALTGRPVDAERWAGAVDRWQDGDPARQRTGCHPTSSTFQRRSRIYGLSQREREVVAALLPEATPAP
jgi:hypothetical protein